MPLDPVIAGGFRGLQLQDPLELYGRVNQLQQLQQQNQLNALKMQEYQREVETNNRLRALYARPGVDLSSPDFLREVYAVSPTAGAAVQKSAFEARKAQQEADEAADKRKKAAADLAASYVKQARDQLPMVSDPQTYAAWRAQTLQRLPGFEPLIPADYSPQIVQRLALDADKMLEQHFVTQNLGGAQQVVAMPKYGAGGARVVPGTLAAEVPLPPNVEAQKARLAQAGATTVLNRINAFAPASEKAQEAYIAAMSDERKVLRTAPDTLKNIDAAKKLIPSASAFMGKGGEPLLAAASFLNNRLGFNINTQGVTDATVLRTRLFESILDNLKKLDSQPSQEQQRVLAEALGNLGTDPQALVQILDRIGETVQDRVTRYNTDVSEAEQRGVKFPFKPQINLPPRAGAQAGGASVTLPDGRVMNFPNAEAAAAFKKAAGL